MDLGVKILVCFSLVLYHGAFAQIWVNLHCMQIVQTNLLKKIFFHTF